MDKEKYLNRIKFSKSFEPSLDALKGLQKNHLLHVPFENLDIVLTLVPFHTLHQYEKFH